jgi:predicted ATPase/DNA-binding CsgD family transcriptional regulator
VENAPADLTSFVGRRRELSQVKSLLSSTRLLTLTGVGGVGKTRLALRAAEKLLRAFRDGIWLVDFAPLRDEKLLASTVTAALKLGEDRAGVPPSVRLSEYLSDKQLLLVLDNCEHMIPGCAELAGQLLRAAPDLRILATSRQSLGIDGESLLTVSGLPLPEPGAPQSAFLLSEAVQLFEMRAAAISPSFKGTPDNVEVISMICQRLDGLPLAIELAAVQMRTLSVGSLLARLDDRFRPMKKGLRRAPHRNQTLEQTLEWSYGLCSQSEQELWARMSVFAGACELEAIERVCSGEQITTTQVLDLAASLIDKSIISREGNGSWSRYRLLETIREFGYDRLMSAGDAEIVRARHSDYYLDLIQQAGSEWFGPRQAEWLDRLRANRLDMQTALEYSLTAPGKARTGLEAAANCHIFWLITGTLQQGTTWLKRALQLNPEPTASRAMALQGGAYMMIMLGDIATGWSMLQECQAIGKQVDDMSVLAYADLRVGAAKMEMEDFCGAFSSLEKALFQLRRLGDQFGIYFALRYLSMAATGMADPRAHDIARECLSLCETNQAELSKSWALWVVGLEEWQHGETRRAIDRIHESLQIKAAFGDLAGVAHCVEVLAWVEAGGEDMRRAARLFGAADASWQKAGSALGKSGYLQRFHSSAEDRARNTLNAEEYRHHFDEGRKLDDVIAYLLPNNTPGIIPSEPKEPEQDTLTRREQQVAELVTLGMTNKEIATELVVSRRTVECHIGSILSKLGFHSRTQIATRIAKKKNEAE